ncbi:MAG: FtsX-like permease family protein [Steroidobacteraceae bacterium]
MRLWWALWLAGWRDRPGRLFASIFALALGVALASAVHLVNRSALDEFEQAARRFAGEADFIVRGAPSGLAEALYPAVARAPGVAFASPVLELSVAAYPAGATPPRTVVLPILALDPLRATRLQPALLGSLAGALRGFFGPNGVFLSARAAAELDLRTGSTFEVLVGTSRRRLEVLGLLDEAAYPGMLGIMDIAAAQWLFGRLGVLDRIDVRVAQGASAPSVRAAIAPLLPAGVSIAVPGVDSARIASATRAYRVNLDMLALVAVLTGGFLVLATQALSVLRRRTALGLLRALGVTRSELRRALVIEGALSGVIGAVVGVALGQEVGAFLLQAFAGDLGAGQFRGVVERPVLQPLEALAFVVAGTLTAAAAAWLPAHEAAARPPARALKAGDAEVLLARVRPWRWGLALVAVGVALAGLPALHGLPVFGYGAIAALLAGGVLLVPGIAARVLAAWPPPRNAPLALAVAQLRGSIAQASIGLAAVIVSFSLMVAMAIMVHSFRVSFVDWLARSLPAGLQLRIGHGSDTATLDEATQARLAAVGGIETAEFRRTFAVSLRRGMTPVHVVATNLDGEQAPPQLAIVTSARVERAAGEAPLWISEAMQDLYGWRAGDDVTLPIAGRAIRFRVAGVYRDYGRSSGSVVLSRVLYRSLTGDRSANEAVFRLAPDASPDAVVRAMHAAVDVGAALQIRTTHEVRERSLANFDRAFAVTYALEAIAVLIGLLGVGVSAAAMALARRGEFGMLRHIGLLRRQVLAMLAGEGLLTSTIGVGCALALGGVLSIVLVRVINRQSFLWSIDLAVPWGLLAALVLALLTLAAATAFVSGRAALAGDAVRAVREDW